MVVCKGQVTIQTANIATKITLYKGIDTNHDGVMDRGIDESLPESNQNDNNGRYVEVTKAATLNEETNITNLCLEFENVIPRAVYTWKLVVENRGDAAGYLRGQISKDISQDSANSSEIFDYFKFFTVNGARTNKDTGIYDNTYPYSSSFIGKNYFALDSEGRANYLQWNNLDDMITKINVFGNTLNDRIAVGEIKVYVFRFQLKAFDELLDNGLVKESDKTEYQSLQGKAFATQVPLLDIILSTDQPEL